MNIDFKTLWRRYIEDAKNTNKTITKQVIPKPSASSSVQQTQQTTLKTPTIRVAGQEL